MKKGIIYSFIISLVICMIMPFTVNADSIDPSIDLVGITLSSVDSQSGGGTSSCVFELVLKREFIGTVIYTVRFQKGTIDETRTLVFRVNGTSSFCNAIFTGYPIVYTDLTYTYVRSNGFFVTDDNNIRQWHFPIESLGIVFPTFEYGFDQVGMISFNDYDFPIFNIPDNSLIFRTYGNLDHKYHWIFIADKNYYNLSLLQQNFTITNGSITKFGYINRFYYNYDIRYIFNIEVTSSSDSFLSITYNGGSDMLYMPIYFNDYLFNDISTDFALRFGLSNQLLDDLHIVAQGTQQSQSAAGDLEQGNQDLASDISSYNQIESDYNNQMNQALNNIDFSDQFSNNQNFLSGASFVKTVFNSFMQIDILRIFFIVLCIVLIAKRFI